MGADRYVDALNEFRTARGHLKWIEEVCRNLCDELLTDFEALNVVLVGERAEEGAKRDDDQDDEEFRVDLNVWMDGAEISQAILRFRNAQAKLDLEWASLSEPERSALKSPTDLENEGR